MRRSRAGGTWRVALLGLVTAGWFVVAPAAAEVEFQLSSDPAEPVLAWVMSGGMLGAEDAIVLYGDGRLARRAVAEHAAEATRSEGRLSYHEMEEIVRAAIGGGLMEFAAESYPELEHLNVADLGSAALTIRLASYGVETGTKSARPVSRTVRMHAPWLVAARLPQVTEARALIEVYDTLSRALDSAPGGDHE